MTREQKIEALVNEYHAEEVLMRTCPVCYKNGILAGIALRDAELLEMEFDENSTEFHKIADKYFCQALNQGKDDATLTDVIFFSGVDCARWQHEQFMKAIKGDGDE